MYDNQNMPNVTRISSNDIKELLQLFSKFTYRACDQNDEYNKILERSIELIKLDYNVSLINNTNGDLCSHYPSQLVLLESEKNHSSTDFGNAQRQTNTIYESMPEEHRLRDMFSKARFARCRARFPLPVILYKGKYVCRSSTLSGGPEIYGRSSLDYFFPGTVSDPIPDSDEEEDKQFDWQLFNRVRSRDIELLKSFNVGIIVDFMVEKKKVKLGLNITSSEKVDKENRYASFKIISLPYPGCEFFKEFRDNNYTARGLIFNWSQAYVDAPIQVPSEVNTFQLQISWEKYKDWDLVEITQNYMKLMLKYIQENNTGLLIHCISGWDRTPLFISLLRICLWADGLIHQKLDAFQMIYLTVSYDWMFFGHHLIDRLGKGEEIFFFCFYMIKFLQGDAFSIAYPPKHKTAKHSDRPNANDKPNANTGANANACAAEKLNANDKPVNRTDSDSQLEILLDELNGSNVSLNSSCSSVSSKSQELPNSNFQFFDETQNGNQLDLNGSLMWPAQQRRTSPVAVPIPSRLRQRQESTSSIGSWQFISGTGSLKGSDSNSTIDSSYSIISSNRSEGVHSQDVPHPMPDREEILNHLQTRRARLDDLRSTFYHIYSTSVGFRFKNGESTFSNLLGSAAEKLGFTSQRV